VGVRLNRKALSVFANILEEIPSLHHADVNLAVGDATVTRSDSVTRFQRRETSFNVVKRTLSLLTTTSTFAPGPHFRWWGVQDSNL
jgi:hypothetical protein